MARSLYEQNRQNLFFFRLDNKLGKHHVNIYFLFYLMCSPEKSHMRPEVHVQFGSQAFAVMLWLRLTNTKKRQFTQLLLSSSELHIRKEHCCL